jgi:hypothetical protein
MMVDENKENEIKDIKTNFTKENIRKYILVYLLMEIIRLPEIELYWSKSNHFKIPIFSKIMTGILIKLMNRYIHFNDNHKFNNSCDKLFKVFPVIEILNDKWHEYATPNLI